MKKPLIVFCCLLGVLFLTMSFVIAGFAVSPVYLDKDTIYHIPSTQIVFDHGYFNVVYFKNDDISDKTLMFCTTHMQVDVDVNNQTIYSCGYETDAPGFIKSTGTIYHVVRLPKDYTNSAVRIKTVPLYEGNPPNPQLYIYGGSYSSCIMQLCFWALPIVISAFILLFSSAVLFFLYLRYLRKIPALSKSGVISLALLALCLSVWLMSLKGGLQFYFSSPYILYFVSAFSFLVLPVPFNIFLHALCKTKLKKGFAVFSWIFMANTLLQLAFQLFTPFDMFYLKPLTYGLMLLDFFYGLTVCLYETKKHKNRATRSCLLPFILLGLIATLYAFILIMDGDSTLIAYMVTYTLLFSFVVYGRILFQSYAAAQKERKQKQYYEELALADILCGVRSREAYQDMLEQLTKDGNNPAYQVCIAFGVDRQNVAPEYLDTALCACCHAIKATLPPEGLCYRVSDDEFVFILDDFIGVMLLIQRFQSFTKTMNLPFPLQIACDYTFFDEDRDLSFAHTLRRVLRDMRKKRTDAAASTALPQSEPSTQ